MTAEDSLSAFIIVTYNSSSVIEECLRPLISLARKGHQVIVVDNDSTDNTVALCRATVPDARIIRNSANVGFARAVNRGAAVSNAETIVLLNPDAVGTSSAFGELLQRSYHSPSAVIAPMIVHPEQRLSVVSAGRQPYLLRMLLHYSGLARLVGEGPLEGHYLYPHQVKADRSVEWATGACLVIPRNIWLSLGGLTERWFMYAEDIEFCHRVVSAGYKIWLCPGIQISHAAGTGTAEPKSMRADWIENLWRFYNEDLSPNRMTSLVWKLLVSCGLFTRSFAYYLRSASSPDRQSWRHEARRFWSFGLATLRVK
ncbi:glycosyltransferase family 2 protein [Paenarthrobacter ureafaciens]